MKITFITSLKTITETDRILEELNKMGHEVTFVYLKEFSYTVENGEINIPGLTDIEADVVIARDILVSIKEFIAVMKHLRQKGVKVFDNNLGNTQYSINKTTDVMKMAFANVSVPNTFYSRNIEDYYSYKEKLNFPFIIKRTTLGKGVGIFKVNNDEELNNLLDRVRAEGKDEIRKYIAQEFIDYVHDLRVLTVGDKAFAMKRIPAEGEFRANFSLGGSVELFEIDDETKELAFKALKSMDMTYGGVDVLIDKNNKEYILEVNHNAGFAGMEKATGKNIAKVYIEYALANAF